MAAVSGNRVSPAWRWKLMKLMSQTEAHDGELAGGADPRARSRGLPAAGLRSHGFRNP